MNQRIRWSIRSTCVLHALTSKLTALLSQHHPANQSSPASLSGRNSKPSQSPRCLDPRTADGKGQESICPCGDSTHEGLHHLYAPLMCASLCVPCVYECTCMHANVCLCAFVYVCMCTILSGCALSVGYVHTRTHYTFGSLPHQCCVVF